MNTTGIALCIPAYNSAAFLPRLLTSAQAQTKPFSEIWVYDDASTDNTAEVAACFGARVVRGEANHGCSHGKNALVQATSCGWLHFHDADDELCPDFVEKAKPWITANTADVVFFSYETRFHETNEHVGFRHFDDAALKNDPLTYVLTEQINPFCGLYRRDAFLRAGGWDEDREILQAEDQAGHFKMAAAGLRFAADSSVTVVNYIRQGSMTTSNLAGANRAVFRYLAKTLRQNLLPVHAQIVGIRLWRVAGSAAAYLDWATADQAAALAEYHSAIFPPETGLLFRILSPLSPRFALRVREFLIRTLRPALRQGAVCHPPRQSRV